MNSARVKGIVPKENTVDLEFACPMDHAARTWIASTLKIVFPLLAALVTFIVIREVVRESAVLHVRMKKNLLNAKMMLVKPTLVKKVSLVFRIIVVVAVQFTLMAQETKCVSRM